MNINEAKERVWCGDEVESENGCTMAFYFALGKIVCDGPKWGTKPEGEWSIKQTRQQRLDVPRNQFGTNPFGYFSVDRNKDWTDQRWKEELTRRAKEEADFA